MKKRLSELDEQENYILLKIKRQISTDESTKFLLSIVSKLQIKNGSLKSEMFELSDKNKKLLKEIQELKNGNAFRKDRQKLQETVYKLSKENQALKSKKTIVNQEWQGKGSY